MCTLRTSLLAAPCLAAAFAAGTGAAAPKEKDRLVFAHYMACLSNGVEFAKQEIELAQRHGIDGFALNCLNWGRHDPKTGKITLSGHGKGAADLYEAARQLDSGFKLFVSADVNGRLAPLPAMMHDMVMRYKDHPNQFRHEGKVVLSAWAGSPQTYAEGCRRIEADGVEVHFVPFVGNEKHMMAWSMESMLRLFDGQPHMDGWFLFTCDGLVADLIRSNAVARRATQYLGTTYMAGVCPAYNSPNLRDLNGMSGYGALWEGLINDGADWVEIVTWNDYNEDSNLMPYRWKEGWQRQYYDRDESYLDLTAYHSAWFKSGRRPRITQDRVFFVYRTRSKWLTTAWDAETRSWVDITSMKWPFDQIHDDVGDYVYATTYLTAPASLSLAIGGTPTDFDMPAGVAHAHVPLRAGVPRAVLRRRGAVLLDVWGRKQIVDRPTEMNSPRGYHLLNRTWANAAAAGRPRRLAAASGELHDGAAIVTSGRTRAVRNEEREGSGFTVAVGGLTTSTYNVRIRYSNPDDQEARLTLAADGPPRRAGAYPYYIPAFLPPTGEGRFATTSVFWSLYDSTTFLRLAWEPGRGGSTSDKAHPLYDDHGRVLVEAIELVRVEPFEVQRRDDSVFPAMTHVPGGSFTMGCDDGHPDEKPRHRVTVSSFAMSTCEITNEEYERFDPGHRRFRDGFSWRDREPVIYVAWRDGARYCNWLSAQAGLAAAYDEKSLTMNPAAEGFRMPTEAEWEYVATGRGRGWRYPWGEEEPDATRGTFQLAASLRFDPVMPSDEGGGTKVVGSHPAGASRDGIMDLAGNVAEWCSDWYQPYGAGSQSDPCGQRPGHHRVIRGGSWGYYNHSQRSVDREFNSQVYPGYVYLGLRVVLPEEGWRRLRR